MSQSKVDERDHYEGKFSEANVEEESNQSVHSSSDDGEDSGHEFELVDMVWDFANSSELADEFEEFIRDHFDELRDIAPLNSEQKLEHKHLFEQLLSKCEEKVEDFLESKGKSVGEFVSCCRQILTRDDVDEDLICFHEMVVDMMNAKFEQDEDASDSEPDGESKGSLRSAK
eukprot:g1982.t1